MGLMKWCSYHKTLHPTSAFSKAAAAADGLSWYCREGQREYREKNRDRINALHRAYWPTRAAKRSLALALSRKNKKTYHSKHNPLALPPEQRTA